MNIMDNTFFMVILPIVTALIGFGVGVFITKSNQACKKCLERDNAENLEIKRLQQEADELNRGF